MALEMEGNFERERYYQDVKNFTVHSLPQNMSILVHYLFLCTTDHSLKKRIFGTTH